MTYIIIGSGIAGVNAAMTLLERGKQVEIWDADLADPSYLNKSNVPESYYGENLKGIIDPSSDSLFELPENRSYYLKKNSHLWEFNDDENFNVAKFIPTVGSLSSLCFSLITLESERKLLVVVFK